MNSRLKYTLSDLEREVNRLKGENGRLQEQLLIEKTHFLDIESFAKEQLAGNSPDDILQRLVIVFNT